MYKGVNQKSYFQHSSKHIICHFRFFGFSIGGDNPNIIFQLFIKNFTYFEFCRFFSHNIIYHIFGLQYSLALQGRKLVVLKNIINQKYPLQHSRNLCYHLQKIMHHIQIIRPQLLFLINYNIKTVLPFKTRWTSQIQMIHKI